MIPMEALYCIEMGTTRCRVWLTEGDRVWAHAEGEFGVRDVTRGASRDQLRERLEDLIVRSGELGRRAGLQSMPRCAVAAGMLTSGQGLHEIPHLPAPASELDLARKMQRLPASLGGPIELFLMPGVRTGTPSSGLRAALCSDVMRGEETLTIGLLATGQLDAKGAVLNLGSHWKWIQVDEQERIARSRTALTGELIHAAQTSTMLASALPQTKPSILHEEWLEQGGHEAERSGLSRALFCVRLLEQAKQGTPEERLSFLYGAFLEMEILALLQDESFLKATSICLVGPSALALAWQRRLKQMGKATRVIEEAQRDHAYLQGLNRLFALAKQAGAVPASTRTA